MLNFRHSRSTLPEREQGFSLLELSIVLLIVGLLLGGLIMPLGSRMDQQRIESTNRQLEQVREALIGYALANDALPCPATPASSGLASATATGCTRQHGFVPAATLGLPGSRNADQLLLDAWGNPLRYSVSNSDADGDGNWDFVRPGEMRNVTLANLAPSLDVCTTAAGSSATACAGSATTITANAPAVLLSLGKDFATLSSADEQENVGTNLGGGPSGRSYPVAGDEVFVSRSISTAGGSGFDDLVTWIAPATLYGQMVSAGRLP
ncbi:MAG: prepilin-type N-terminal cleavage/methylation domain-containing protein [Gammaproteobacteria bacterium]|nr:prepilin-type N-terminal cleavage/methylation domain-containing protein [Gammaproteobacteria bacterium]